VSYSDYAESVEDQLALCLTGFPEFDREAAQRRSLIYVGPSQLRAPDDPRPALFTAEQVTDVARAAGVQVDVLATGPDSAFLSALVRDTGGQEFPADSGVAAHLTAIRNDPPAATSSGTQDAGTSIESPDIPLIVAILAAAVLTAWPVVQRR
jgi:hypothetical protein